MRRLFLILLLLLVALPVGAQTAVVNPKTVEFTPSADHAALLEGVPMVAKYELRIFLEVGGTLLTTTDIGKPTPVSNLISITNPIWFAPLTPKTRYIARVAAVGPTGEGVSDPSGPFLNAGAPANPGAPTLKK
jgi:hypothetical protein